MITPFHNAITVNTYGIDLLHEAIKQSNEWREARIIQEKRTALDFYYHDQEQVDKHIEKYFPGETLSQIPVSVPRIMPRFARARNMVYKNAPERFIGNDIADDYLDATYRLDTFSRQFNEMVWLMGECACLSNWSERNQRIEYKPLWNFKTFHFPGENEPYAVTYEVDRGLNKERQFVFWSETRDGVQGSHFKYTQGGKLVDIPGGDGTNPYDVLPISFVKYTSAAFDVTRAAIHAGITSTEINLGVRFQLGQPVVTGVDDSFRMLAGPDRVAILPEAATFSYVSPPGNLSQMIEATKEQINMTATNHHLRIKWADTQGQVPSGLSLMIQEMENLESRESDVPYWREWEQSRYEIDRQIIRSHTGKDFGDSYYVDFSEISFPLGEKEQLEVWKLKMDMGLISKKEILHKLNPDADEKEIEEKLGIIQEETQVEAPTVPEQPIFEGLRKLGSVGA